MLIFTSLFYQILVVRKPFQRELGCAKRGRFLKRFFQILVVRKQFKREHDVDQFLGCKLKFDDSGLENYERGCDFYFGVVAPTLGD